MEVTFTVSAMDTNWDEFAMEVGIDENINTLKGRIQGFTGIRVEDQCLIFEWKRMTQLKRTLFCPGPSYSHFPPGITVPPPCITVLKPYVVPEQGNVGRVPILIKEPNPNKWFSVKIYMGQTVRKLKEVIRQLTNVPLNKVILHYLDPHKELQDWAKLYQCGIGMFGFAEVTLSFRSNVFGPRLPPGYVAGEDRLTVYLTDQMFPVEVGGSHKVGVLREEIICLSLEQQILLLQGEFKFYYEERSLDEQETFLSQSVKHGSQITVQEVDEDFDDSDTTTLW